MEAIIMNMKKYTLADTIIKATPIWCKGVRNGRELIKKKKIEEKHFIYARYVNNEWTHTEGKSAKYDKVLIRNICLDKIEKYINEINNNIVDELLLDLPPVITLKDHEKFYNNNEIFEIETRGERKSDKIYFKVKDVAANFEINDLQHTIIKKESKYKSVEHFTCFKGILSHGNKKEYYLTYTGILKVLFSSRSGNVSSFVNWATKTLFTVQLGTQQQKKKLSSDMLGIPIDDFNTIMLKPNTKTSIASIYFITLGKAKDVRTSMNLDDSILDDDIISIYGRTDDLKRRLLEHKNKYKNIDGANLLLKYYSFIDKTQLSKAEKDIGNYFKSIYAHLDYDSEKEMVCTDLNCIKYLESHFQTIGKRYEGDHGEIIQQMKDMEIKFKYELQTKDHELQHKDYEIQGKEYEKKIIFEQHAKEIALKDVEVLEWKNKALEWKIKSMETIHN